MPHFVNEGGVQDPSKGYRGKNMTPARDPKPGWSYRRGWSQTGVGLPNGLRRRKSGAPKIQNFGFSTKSQKMYFLRGFLKNPSVESVTGEHAQLFTEGFPVIFHEGPLSSWNRLFLADFMCRFRTRSPMFACEGLVVAWEA